MLSLRNVLVTLQNIEDNKQHYFSYICPSNQVNTELADVIESLKTKAEEVENSDNASDDEDSDHSSGKGVDAENDLVEKMAVDKPDVIDEVSEGSKRKRGNNKAAASSKGRGAKTQRNKKAKKEATQA